MKSGDIVTFNGSPHRWTIVGPAASPGSHPWWQIARKGTDAHESKAEFTSRTQAEGSLTLIESPTFADNESVRTLNTKGIVDHDTGADLIKCQIEGDRRPLTLGDSNWDGEGLKGIPDGDVHVAIDAGIEMVPRWILVLRNRL